MSEIITHVTSILAIEAAAVARLAELAITQADAVEQVCSLIRSRCGDGQPGRLVVTGVGKAGHIARKLAATFASTGTPSFFMHPSEARHGDLGMVQRADVVFAISNSGSSEEVLVLLPNLRHIGCPLLALVGRTASPLASHADHVVSIGPVIEACPLGLAPSTSTTAMLALGDAIALTVQRLRNFTPEQYARYHPGGALGRKLMTCAEAMRTGARAPRIRFDQSVVAALRAITSARAGSVSLIDHQDRLIGIFTDGDLRRAISSTDDVAKVLHGQVVAVATMPCRSVRGTDLLQSALRLCSERKLNEVPVVDEDERMIGLLDIQDLIDRGFEIGV